MSGISITVDSNSVTSGGSDTYSLETCVNESVEGSATAVVGYDRVSQTSAVYRFQFKSGNIYPKNAGFRITMPSGYTFAEVSGYTLVCNGGCTVGSSIAKAKSSNVLTFTDAFSTNIAAGTLIDISVTGFINPSTETVYSVYYEIIWDSSAYLIDSGLASKYSNTLILITSRTMQSTQDCRISIP